MHNQPPPGNPDPYYPNKCNTISAAYAPMDYPPVQPGQTVSAAQPNPNFQYGYDKGQRTPLAQPQLMQQQYPAYRGAPQPMQGSRPPSHHQQFHGDNLGGYKPQGPPLPTTVPAQSRDSSQRGQYGDSRAGRGDYAPNSNKGGFNAPRSATSQQPSMCGEDVETQEDTIFIQNLPSLCTREQLAEAFGSIGVIKMDKRTRLPRVWIYKDKNTGNGKGEATVTYDDPESASAAIRWFDQKEVLGTKVTVTLAFRKRNMNFKQRGGGRGRGGYDSGSGSYGGRGWQQRGSNDGFGTGDSGPMRRSGGYHGGRGRPY